MDDELDWDRVREGALQLGISPNVFNVWKHRGRVPHRYHYQLISMGKASWSALSRTAARKPWWEKEGRS